MYRLRFIYYLLLVIFLESCATPLKDLVYINGIEPNTLHPTMQKPEIYRIRSNDRLYIRVNTKDQQSAAFLNPSNEVQYIGGAVSELQIERQTHKVDEEGYIQFQSIGKIKVGGQTLDEARKIIQNEIDTFLRDGIVTVVLASKFITILGEVNGRGQHDMEKEEMTIFERTRPQVYQKKVRSLICILYVGSA